MANLPVNLARFAAHASGSTGDLLADDTFLLGQEGSLSVRWAPFDHAPPEARVAVVGITPGRTQATNAMKAFTAALRQGQPVEAALRQAKLVGSFSGAMRTNIVRMLDYLGVHEAMDVPSCASLFDPACEQVHFTSALRYPVFVDGANYNGSPDMLRTPLLRGMVDHYLADEVRALPGALWLPLGPKPSAALRHLVSAGVLPADRVLEGMPHPSGANAERIKFFLGLKARSELSSKTLPEVIERARELLLGQVARLGSI